MAEGRAPIKVGTGYIEITPKVTSKDLSELRVKVQAEMEKIGVAAARNLNQAVSTGLAGLPREAAKQAAKAKQAIEGEAKDTAKTLQAIERQITREFGEETAKRFREFREAEIKKQQLLEQTSTETRTALRQSVRLEEQAARDRQNAAERLERERRRLLEQTQREQERLEREQTRTTEREARLRLQAEREALRQQVAAQREATRERLALIRSEAQAQREAHQAGIATQQQIITQTRDRMRDLQRQMTATTTSTQTLFGRTEAGLKKLGTNFENIGNSITETGNILATKFLAPLALAGGLLTTVGVKSADSLILGQLGLMGSNVSAKDSAAALQKIRQYGVDTPFSIEDMQMYMTRYIRSLYSHEEGSQSKDPKKKQQAGKKASERAADIVMMIGDNAAKAGNLDPAMVSRAMYAIDMILDLERVPTRNLKQFTAAAGIPVQELAQLMGYQDKMVKGKDGQPTKHTAAAQILELMANAKETGGLQGPEMIQALIDNWMGTDTQGYAKKVTSATITGRIQQMKEGAQLGLGNLFAKTDPETGMVEYTGLGERIMGKKVTKKDHWGQESTSFEGGYLNELQDMAREYGPKIPKFLDLFFDAIDSFTSQIKTVANFLEQHPEIKEVAVKIAEFLVKWGPLIIAVGLLSKVLGKVTGLVGRAFGPLAAVTRAAGNGAQGANDVRHQARARREARREARDRGDSRSQIRQAGRDAYRQTRTDRSGGDNRSVGRRVVDSALGRSGPSGNERQEMAELERQAREARDETTRLRTELRELNSQTLRDIAAALGSGGNNSVQGAAQQAQNSVNQVQQQAQQLNRTSVSQLRQELDQADEAARKLTAELDQAAGKARGLDGVHLNAIKAEIDALKTAAENAGSQVTSVNTRVGNLNGKDVRQVKGSIDDLTNSARSAADQVGDGAMSSSVSGRVANLNKRRLTEVIQEFRNLLNAAHDAYEKVGQGTGAGSLAGRIGLLNQRSLSDVKGKVDDLARALKNAREEGDGLDGALDRIGKKSPGGGGSSSGGKKKARGGVMRPTDVSYAGVMPGYAPWVDNIPAILSPGEAVLRPEVTNALGESTINTWNALAIRGKLSRNARGTSGGGGKLDLDAIKELVSLQSIAPVGTAMLKTMKLDGTSDRLGGSVQDGILRTGDGSSRLGGSAAADNFRGMYNWMTDDVFNLLRKVPTLVGQAAGILGGALAPVQADYFWNDVWKGDGNIVQRGKDYMGHLFSMETLGKVWDNLYSGVGDSLGAIWDLVSDPIGAFTDAFGDIGGIVSGSYNNIIDMIETVKEIKDSPLGYAGRVYGAFMENAKESMPNTEGLFDFKNGSTVQASMPDFAAGLAPKAGAGGAGQWAPTALQAMSMLGIPSSALQTVLYRIGMESGGDPMIVNKWDSNWQAGYPSVGLMQVIGPTFDAYAGPFRNSQPKLYGTSVNPLANIYAGLNYATKRYGSGWMRMLAGNTGYAAGTLSASPGFALVGEKGRELVHFGGGERVYNNLETESMLNGKKYEIHIHEARHEPTAQAVMRALQTAEALYTNL
ncbi:transglycosylase SLT domain-containing protein [Streptomyces sp. H27-H5]|uniref:transglycosylase SLT domain-containing protein n=1 Tax=Streptomyces sp. H27-H5 TaxID=2996460 RepID=UPI00227214CA|nr:transglycosylase SLT domain-containing protein [Streptomyces sp. H27-H5]MCY0962733.1 transglycosylase SLT domain-containing protein [Streptomyces sp. H27-H5]